MIQTTDLTRLTALQMAEKLQSGEITSKELTQAHLDRIHAIDGDAESGVHAFLHVNDKEALEVAVEVDQLRGQGAELHPLAGVPIAIKDLLVTVGQPTTAASTILKDWMSPYDATVIRKIREAKLPILGKTNLDEFAMGSTTEFSAYGPTRNPWDTTRVPGGSGGGSAVAVAAFMAPLAIGTDTGGSIRQPGSFTGTVGAKPTYGSVSRYGAIAMASSLDTVGPVARTVADAAALHELIAGHDPHDSTSLQREWDDLAPAVVAGEDLTGLKIGVIEELDGEGFDAGVLECFQASLRLLEDAGAEIVRVALPHLKAALPAYYLIMPSEASSNLARYDGVRYGNRVVPEQATIDRVMSATRAAGFGDEVKRRIILGTYALSAGYYDAYYGSAQKVRTLVQRDFAAAFEKVDALISPTTPTTAIALGEELDDPIAMYLNDVATLPSNLAGIPAISVPGGLASNMPVGVQIQAPATEDALMYRIGAALETGLKASHDGADFFSLLPNAYESDAR